MSEILSLSWAEIQRDAERLAALARRDPPWRGLIAVSRGGLAPALLLAQAWGVRQIETVCLRSYEETRRGAVELLKAPAVDPDGEGWLIVDDLVDSGETMKFLRQLLPKAAVAALYAKPAGAALADYSVRAVDQSVWISFPWERTAVIA